MMLSPSAGAGQPTIAVDDAKTETLTTTPGDAGVLGSSASSLTDAASQVTRTSAEAKLRDLEAQIAAKDNRQRELEEQLAAQRSHFERALAVQNEVSAARAARIRELEQALGEGSAGATPMSLTPISAASVAAQLQAVGGGDVLNEDDTAVQTAMAAELQAELGVMQARLAQFRDSAAAMEARLKAKRRQEKDVGGGLGICEEEGVMTESEQVAVAGGFPEAHDNANGFTPLASPTKLFVPSAPPSSFSSVSAPGIAASSPVQCTAPCTHSDAGAVTARAPTKDSRDPVALLERQYVTLTGPVSARGREPETVVARPYVVSMVGLGDHGSSRGHGPRSRGVSAEPILMTRLRPGCSEIIGGGGSSSASCGGAVAGAASAAGAWGAVRGGLVNGQQRPHEVVRQQSLVQRQVVSARHPEGQGNLAARATGSGSGGRTARASNHMLVRSVTAPQNFGARLPISRQCSAVMPGDPGCVEVAEKVHVVTAAAAAAAAVAASGGMSTGSSCALGGASVATGGASSATAAVSPGVLRQVSAVLPGEAGSRHQSSPRHLPAPGASHQSGGELLLRTAAPASIQVRTAWAPSLQKDPHGNSTAPAPSRAHSNCLSASVPGGVGTVAARRLSAPAAAPMAAPAKAHGVPIQRAAPTGRLPGSAVAPAGGSRP